MIETYWSDDMLPTMGEYLDHMNVKYGDVFKRIKEKYQYKLKATPVLPIKSDPTSSDSDGDGKLDHEEKVEDRMIYNPIDLNIDSGLQTYIGAKQYQMFRINTNGTVCLNIYSDGETDVDAEILEMKNGKFIRRDSNNDSGEKGNFRFECKNIPSNKWYVKVTVKDGKSGGTYKINANKYQDTIKSIQFGGTWKRKSTQSAKDAVSPQIVYRTYIPARQIEWFKEIMADDQFYNGLDDIYSFNKDVAIALIFKKIPWAKLGKVGTVGNAYATSSATVQSIVDVTYYGIMNSFFKQDPFSSMMQDEIEEKSNNGTTGIVVVTQRGPSLNSGTSYVVSIETWDDNNEGLMLGEPGVKGEFAIGEYYYTHAAF